MKSVLLTLLLLLASVPAWAEYENIRVTVTAYCPCQKCCGRWADGRYATGRRIRKSDYAFAVSRDLKQYLPLDRSQMHIPGYNKYPEQRSVCRDLMGRQAWRQIDVLMTVWKNGKSPHQRALAWGKKTLTIRVRKGGMAWGSTGSSTSESIAGVECYLVAASPSVLERSTVVCFEWEPPSAPGSTPSARRPDERSHSEEQMPTPPSMTSVTPPRSRSASIDTGLSRSRGRFRTKQKSGPPISSSRTLASPSTWPRPTTSSGRKSAIELRSGTNCEM